MARAGAARLRGEPYKSGLRDPGELEELKVTVMGLGLFGGGSGLTRFLVSRGARVTVTDLREAADLKKSLDSIEGIPHRLVLGGHSKDDFTSADLVVANPAVPPGSPYLRAAIEAGVPVESEINLAFRFLPTPYTVGVTGSNGKTTTSHLIHRMASACGRRTWLGGNMGGSLLEHLDRIGPEDLAVIELSSFQLETLGSAGLGPRIAVITNVTPNHLDRHGTFEAYVKAKKIILNRARKAVFNADDPVCAGLADDFRAGSAETDPSRDCVFFSSRAFLDNGICIDKGRVVQTRGGEVRELVGKDDVVLPGLFNLENMMAALAGAGLAMEKDDIPPEAVEAGARFRGVPHRLETVGFRNDVRYVNDSVATTPESTLAALDCFSGEVALIAGGYDKGISLDRLGAGIRQKVRVVYLIGRTAGRLEKAIRSAGDEGPEIVMAGRVEAAVAMARKRARPGWTVLLSPAFASYDQFINFEERGEAFTKCVLWPVKG